MTYSDSDFVVDFYKQGEEIQADLYRVTTLTPISESYDLIDEITIGLIGEFGPGACDRVIDSWKRISSIEFENLGWGQPTEPVIVALDLPRSVPNRTLGSVYSVPVQVSYDFLESVRP